MPRPAANGPGHAVWVFSERDRAGADQFSVASSVADGLSIVRAGAEVAAAKGAWEGSGETVADNHGATSSNVIGLRIN